MKEITSSCGSTTKAEEAAKLDTSIFPDGRIMASPVRPGRDGQRREA